MVKGKKRTNVITKLIYKNFDFLIEQLASTTTKMWLCLRIEISQNTGCINFLNKNLWIYLHVKNLANAQLLQAIVVGNNI